MSEKRVVWLLIKRNARFWVCISLVAFVVLLALIGPLLTPYKPDQVVKEVYRVPESSLQQFINEYRSKGLNVVVGDRIRETYNVSKSDLPSLISNLESKGLRLGEDIFVFNTSDPNKAFVVAIYPERMVQVVYTLQPPSIQHPFGTDKQAFDVFSATVYGLRVSLSMGIIAAIIATLVGVVLGIIAGYLGGLWDAIIDGATNVLIAMPTIFVMIMIGTFYVATETGAPMPEWMRITLVSTTIGLLSWHWVARAVRSQVAALKVNEFINVSKLSGNSTISIIVKDVIPNIASYILLVFVIQLANALGTVVTLEFLGIKASDWSLFAKMNQWVFGGAIVAGMWWIFIPGSIVVILIASLYLLVTALEEVFNPRLRKVE